MRSPLILALMFVVAVLAPRTVFADVTAFLGTNFTPDHRLVLGASAGFGIGPLGFEIEYADTAENKADGAPALKTGMANAMLQSPLPIAGVRPYVTAGAGLYHETLGTSHAHTSVGANIGGGLKIGLFGPLRLRLDYRMFRLGSGALFSPAHRFYAGINLGF